MRYYENIEIERKPPRCWHLPGKLVVFLVSILLCSCSASSKSTAVFRYVDYSCKPIANTSLRITDYKHNFLSGDSAYISTVETDVNGFVEFHRKGDSSLSIYTMEDWSDPWYSSGYKGEPLRHFSDFTDGGNINETSVFNESSRDNPIYIYKKASFEKAVRGMDRDQHIAYFQPGDKEKEFHIGTNSLGGSVELGVINIKPDDKDNYKVSINTGRHGLLHPTEKVDGSVDIMALDAAFTNNIAFDLPKNKGKHFSHYYFRSEKSVQYGIMTVDMSANGIAVIVNVYLDAIYPKHEDVVPAGLLLPQENCGGFLARGHGDLYGHIFLSQSQREAFESDTRQINRPVLQQSAQDRETARLYDTPLAWYQGRIGFSPPDKNTSSKEYNQVLHQHLNGIYTSLNAMNNNGPISDRITLIYNAYRDMFFMNKEDPMQPSELHRLMQRIADDPRTDKAIIAELAAHGIHPANNNLQTVNTPAEHYDFVEEDPSTPSETLAISYRADPRLRWTLSKNPSTPPDILRDIYQKNLSNKDEQDQWYINRGLAANPATPDDILSALFELHQRVITEEMATNTGASPELLARIVDEERKMQPIRNVAKNPSAPTALLERLHRGDYVAVDGKQSLDYELYCNPNTPKSIIYNMEFSLNRVCN